MNSRLLSFSELAEYLSVSIETLDERLEELHLAGLPKPLPVLGNWDRRAVDVWLDDLSGLLFNYVSGPRYPTRPFIHPLNRCPPSEPPRLPSGRVEPKGRNIPPSEASSSYTVAQAADAYLRSFTGAKSSKRDAVYLMNTQILPEFGDNEVADVTAEEIREWLQRVASRPRQLRVKRGEAPLYDYKNFDEDAQRKRRGTANRYLTVLKACLNLAYRDGKVPSDDAWRRVKPFKGTIVKQGGYLTREQCVALVKHLAPNFRIFVQTALLTGARFAELRDLTPECFNKQSGTLFIAKGKYGKSRDVVLTDEGIEHFVNLCDVTKPGSRLLLRSDGRAWTPSDPYKRLDCACQLAGIPKRITFHHLRHTYASLAVMAGVPLLVVAKNLGHSGVEACEKYYAHLAPDYIVNSIRTGSPRLGILD